MLSTIMGTNNTVHTVHSEQKKENTVEYIDLTDESSTITPSPVAIDSMNTVNPIRCCSLTGDIIKQTVSNH